MDVAAQVEKFREYLVDQGLKYTQQRKAIAEVFFENAEEHFSLPELLVLAKRRHASVGYATVYRTMKLMSECGLAVEHKFSDDGHTQYEPSIDGEHHDHILCVLCGRLVEYEDEEIERLQVAVAQRLGFRVRHHTHVIYGECVPACPVAP